MATSSLQLSETADASDDVDPGGGCALWIVDATGRLEPGGLSFLRDRAKAALDYLSAEGQLSVRIVGDEEMAAAHQRHLGEPGTTDVITFELSKTIAGPRPVLDIDMLVCLDEAARQASGRGHPPEREILLYVVHGVLHCQGHDDHDPAAAGAMHAREDEILKAIGVGATFHAREESR
jgi:probable rRNA maturation factor